MADSIFLSRNFVIFSTLLLISSPQIYRLFLSVVPIVQKSGLSLPEKVDSVYIVPGSPGVDTASIGSKIRILVCATGQFRAVANETKRVLQHHFPDVEISFAAYPTPEGRVIATQLVAAAQGFLLVTTIMGVGILKSFGLQQLPSFVEWLSSHKVLSLALTWVSGHQLTQVLLNTGAFEIFCNGKLIFSRLAEEELPYVETLIEGIKQALP